MSDDLTDAARRGLQRAGVHMMRAAIEVVEGIGAFLDEMNKADGDRSTRDTGIERIPLDGEEE
jgi:hypothetical protein